MRPAEGRRNDMVGRRSASRGFTLIELVMVMIVIAIVAAYTVVNNLSAGSYTLRSQAEMLAANLRHAQSMATTRGRSLRVTLTAGTNGTYSVSCVTAGSSPCNVTPVLDPATNTSFSTTVQKDVVIAGPATLDFDNFGKPSAAGTYTLTYGSNTFTVTVAAVTGFITVT
jgi:prepilin-type N-terminal cleavage/methylation domain-containing protein